jgi:hypothetical protein
MPTDEVAAYYSGRNRAAVAMSNAAKEAGIRKIHIELARRSADLADVSGSEVDPSQRQTAPRRHGGFRQRCRFLHNTEATFLTPSAACLTSDRLLARAREAAAGAPAPRNSP